MKPQDIPKPQPKILIVGSAKSGKTAFFQTLGAKGQLICTDNAGWSSALSLEDKFKPARLECDIIPCEETVGDIGSGYTKAKNHIFKVSEEIRAGTYKYKVFGIDNLTTLSTQLLRFIVRNSGILDAQGRLTIKYGGKNNTPFTGIDKPHYGILADEMSSLLNIIYSFPIPVILIAHDISEEIDGIEKRMPCILGQKIGPWIVNNFFEIWYLKLVSGAGDNVQRVLQTVGTATVLAGSRDNLPNLTDVNLGLAAILEKIGCKLN